MPDEVIPPSVTPDLPLNPGETTTTTGNPAPPAENPAGESLLGSISRVFEAHKVKFRPGRGRPRKDGAPKISDVPLGAIPPGQAAVAPVAAPAGRPPDDANFIKKDCRSAVKTVFSTLDRWIYGKAVAAGHDDTAAEKIVAANALTDPEAEGYAELGLALADYFKIKTEMFAIGGACVLVAGTAGRYRMVMKELDRQAAEKKKRANATP